MNVAAHNLDALNAAGNLKTAGTQKAKSSEKLASGYRINKAADDAAGLSISEKMRHQIRGLDTGSNNAETGVSLCQVADGALAEVTSMLQRINELSVQAANDTNTQSDRRAIQSEITEILAEIDNIGKDTMFNGMPLFNGTDDVVRRANGQPYTNAGIDVSEIELVNIDLGRVPFTSSSNGDHLALQAIATSAAGKTWNLIFGNGSTSRSSFRLNYVDASTGDSKTSTVFMRNLRSSNYRTSGNDTWLRDFTYTNDDGVDITITQKVVAQTISDNEKAYSIEYSMENNNQNLDLNVEFMFHADTAYNNNDRCEGYYTNSDRINNYTIYSEANSPFTNGSSSQYVQSGVPDSFSIVDVDNSLSFSEKIVLTGDKPDSLSIGQYSSIDDWVYYDNIQSNSQLGTNTSRKDLGFSLLWNKTLSAGATQTFGFQYGIQTVEYDNNLNNVPIVKDLKTVTTHDYKKNFWIQSGDTRGNGMFLTINEMNAASLGVSEINVCTWIGAENAIAITGAALSNLSAHRGEIGAQQNRLEHTIANNKNASENTSSAESSLRDTDMAEEMVNFSKQNILESAGQSILAQANQNKTNILNLFQ